MGAWIETIDYIGEDYAHPVAPYMGAWIETNKSFEMTRLALVAPYMGAWIETAESGPEFKATASCSLYGSMD